MTTTPATSPATSPATLTIRSGAADLDAWHWAGRGPLATDAGKPVVVMAHGMGGTKDSGLAPFAEALAATGCDVVAFDYAGWGASTGTPRQTVTVADQLADYRAVAAHARTLPAVDRLVLWGVSLSGGHVLSVAAGRDDVAAVVSLTPLVDGLAAGRLAARHHAPRDLARSTVLGLRSRVGKPRTMPIVGPPGSLGAFTIEGAEADYRAIAGPTWVNEVDATVGLELGRVKAVRDAAGVTAPTLVQIADADRSAPPHAAAKAAFAARAHVRHYPCDHFDVWPGKPWHEAAVRHQVEFLTRTLG